LSTAGSTASFAWLADRKIPVPDSRWHIAIGLDVRDEPARGSFDEAVDTRFHIEIYAEEWGYFFCLGGKASWIRITDVPFVHMRDDFGLLATVPGLREIGSELRRIEGAHGVSFRRHHAYVSTSLASAEPAIRNWVLGL
jgi:hypothetical protein